MNHAPARPLYFGSSAGSPLFGWLHPAQGAARVGLVICSPFGREDICAHRSLRKLAEAAAGAGVVALRFDYAGCGNSAGDNFDSGRLGAWTDSVVEATNELRRITGVSQIYVLGLRFGAALATRAALQAGNVAGLIAVAPVVSGRSYLRELTAMAAGARNTSQGASGQDSSDLFETAGFVLTAETREALNALDLQSLSHAPASRVLVVQRDDLPASDRWRNELQRVGAAVEVMQGEGYVGMMADPHHTKVPVQMIDCIVRWLRERHDEAPESQAAASHAALPDSATISLPARDGGGQLREQAVHIDVGGSRLFGVLSTPAGAGSAPRAGIVMLNAGSVRHVGPNRMYVPLARQWAAEGLAVLRLDLSGLGDSAQRQGDDNVVYTNWAVADAEAAVTFMRDRVGARACHLLGLCSGAYHSFKTAVAGRVPVETAVIINSLTFFRKEGQSLDIEFGEHNVTRIAANYRRAMFSPERWLKLLRGKVNMRTLFNVVTRKVGLLLRNRARAVGRLLHIPLKDDLYQELAQATRSGTRLHFVFSERDPGLALLRNNGGRMVDRLMKRGLLSIDLIPDADHTFTMHGARQRLFVVLRRLMEQASPRDSTTPSQAQSAPRDVAGMDPRPAG